MQNKGIISIIASCITLISPQFVRACTIVYPTIEVGRSFRVRVTDRGSPIGGMTVLLGSGGGQIQSITGADGYASFEGLFPGSLLVTTRYDGDMADAVQVEVSDKGPLNATVELAWPNRTPLAVRSVSGILRGPDFFPNRDQGQVSLSLIEGQTARVIETTQSDRKGRFGFATAVPPGIYYLRVNPSEIRAWDGEQIEGAIPIRVDKSASQDSPDLDLGWTSCGLTYAQRESEPDLKVEKICGDVADPEGAVISRAQVFLLNTNDDPEILRQTRSDPNGEFALEGENNHSYELIIKSPGFRPSVRVIHLGGANSSAACTQPVHFRLGVL